VRYGFVVVRNGISWLSSARKRLHRFEYLEELEKMWCLTMRCRGLKGFILLSEQKILRTFGALIHFETEIPRLLDRARSIGSSGSKERGLLSVLHRDKYKKLCELGWVNQSKSLLQSDTAVSTL
jgi:hypothetical protein